VIVAAGVPSSSQTMKVSPALMLRSIPLVIRSSLGRGKARDMGVTITRGSLHQADRGSKGSSNTSAMVALSTILLRWAKRQGWW
jgi:hypothetical protein